MAIIIQITAVLLVKIARCVQKPQPVQLFGEPVQWVDTARYLGGDPRHTAELIDSKSEGRQHRGWACLALTLIHKRCSAVQAAHSSFDGLRVPCQEVFCLH
jgi:hypothetical protein